MSVKPFPPLKSDSIIFSYRFIVTGLDNESEFQLIVYAGNSKGRSSITRLVAITQKLPVKQLETRLSNSGNEGNCLKVTIRC